MKKLFTLLTLLVAIVTGAQAASFIPTTTNTISTNTLILPKDLAGTETWVRIPSKTLTDKGLNPSAWDSDFGTQPTGNVKCLQVKTDGNTYKNSKRVIHMLVTGVTGVKAIGQANSGRGFQIGATEYVEGTTDENTAMTIVAGSSEALNPVSYTGLDASKTYIVSILAYSSDTYLYGIYFTAAPKVPSITTQPQSASYMTGQTMDPLTVVAEASAGDLTYQWYSCDDANKTNAQAIENATSASYTPTAAGFYYVNVADENGNLDSDVAEITVSAAEAPTINVTGAPTGDVKVGTEVILTAAATGTPTPTITWYDSNDQSVATTVGTELTYTVPTDAVGTYTFYAVASNEVEPNATSATQTIVVKEQVATPTITPNGAYFEDEQEVTLACTTDGATIQYSTDNGATWTNYTAALTFTATTTLQAKAVKDGSIDSEVASATFNLVTLVEQTDVTGAATWDWSKFGTKEIKLTDETTPKKSEFFVLQNAVNYGLCSTISNDFGDAQALNVQTEYIVRDQKYFQGGYVKFNTTVPGTVTVKYTNTGNRSNEDDRRFLNVNGVNYGEGTMSSKEADAVTTTTGTLASGEITIKGTLKKDGSDQYLRIYTITFTPTPTVAVEISAAKAASFSSTQALDFSAVEGITAYKATAKSDSYVHLDEVAQVPAGAGVIVKGAEGTYNVPVATGDVAELEGNLLVGTAEATYTVGEDYGKVYKYAKRTSDNVVGFQKAKADWTCQVGHAYLKFSETQARDFIGIFGEEEVVTGIDAIENGTIDNDAPAYNLAGQKVGKGYKGIVIINGKKVVK